MSAVTELGGSARAVGTGRRTTTEVGETVGQQMLRRSKALAGAKVYLVRTGRGSVTEKEAIASATVASLGGSITTSLEDATHAVAATEAGEVPSAAALDTAACALLVNVPVVDSRWLERMSSLPADRHWSEVDPSAFAVDWSTAKKPAMMWPSKPAAPSPERRSPKARRDARQSLRASIAETWDFLTRERPETVEEDELRRAIELSMLDCALCVRPVSSRRQHKSCTAGFEDDDPFRVLGVEKGASADRVKAAFRAKARTCHPDKGGDARDFDRLVRAYKQLLGGGDRAADTPLWLSDGKTTTQRDDDLRDHQDLVEALFQSHGADPVANVRKQISALERLGLEPIEAGATNKDERGRPIANSCFYLSLATSFLAGLQSDAHRAAIGPRGPVALRLKRLIEAAVVRAHPEWVRQGKCGEHVQAFSDFLVYALDAPTISQWAVAVFDSASGFVDIYKGKAFDALPPDAKAANCITIAHVPGHYKALLPLSSSSGSSSSSPPGCRPNLDDLTLALTDNDVFFVVTDG